MVMVEVIVTIEAGIWIADTEISEDNADDLKSLAENGVSDALTAALGGVGWRARDGRRFKLAEIYDSSAKLGEDDANDLKAIVAARLTREDNEAREQERETTADLHRFLARERGV